MLGQLPLDRNLDPSRAGFPMKFLARILFRRVQAIGYGVGELFQAGWNFRLIL